MKSSERSAAEACTWTYSFSSANFETQASARFFPKSLSER